MTPATQAYRANITARFGSLTMQGLAAMENAARSRDPVNHNATGPQTADANYAAIMALINRGFGTTSELQREMGRRKSTVGEHLRRMCALGMIKVETIGQVRVYSRISQEAAE